MPPLDLDRALLLDACDETVKAVEAVEAASGGPPLPPGRELVLPGRGTTFVREVAGPPGAPVLVLLHGWTACADLNWFRCYEPLGREFRVVALDHRGHGRGLRTRRRFRLVDCADDVAAVADLLGHERVVAVGYSMGGAVAQLLWRRHPDRVAGMVLAATAATFSGTRQEQLNFLGLGGIALASRLAPASARRRVAERVLARRDRAYEDWAVAAMLRNDWRAILEAGHELGRFSAVRWLHEVDVPSAVVLTGDDHVVPVRRQLQLLAALPGATAHVVPGEHDSCVTRPEAFVPKLLDACRSVSRRIDAPSRPAGGAVRPIDGAARPQPPATASPSVRSPAARSTARAAATTAPA